VVKLLETYPVAVLSNPDNLTAFVAVVAGSAYCFLGYRLFKFVLGLTGFVLAGGVAGHLAASFYPGHPVVNAAAFLGGGLAGAVAILAFYEVGVFLIGLLGAVLVAHTLLDGYDVAHGPWILLGAAIAGGLIAVLLERAVMTLATAAIGAWGVVAGVTYFATGGALFDVLDEPLRFDGNRWVFVACWGVLTLAGALAQLSTRKRKPRAAEEGK